MHPHDTPPLDAARLPAALAELRELAGTTQAQLATRMGTTQSGVAKLEAGRGDPRLSTLVRWAGALGRTLAVTLPPARDRLGEEAGPLAGMALAGAEPVFLDPRAAAEAHLGPVTAVVGRPGAGKTTYLRSLAAQLAALGVPVVAVAAGHAAELAPAGVGPVGPGAVPDGPLPPGEVLLVDLGPLPGPDRPAQAWTAPERADAAAAAGGLEAALAAVPAGGVLLVEEAGRLAELAPGVLEGFVRTARGTGVGVVLADQSAQAFTAAGLGPFVSRVLAVGGAVTDADAEQVLDLCGLEVTAARLTELRAVSRSQPRVGLLRDLDGRTGWVLLGGSALG